MAEGQEPFRSKEKLCHMAQIRPEARSHREADRPTRGAVEGPEAQEPEKLASARCGGTYTGSAEAQAIRRAPRGVSEVMEGPEARSHHSPQSMEITLR